MSFDAKINECGVIAVLETGEPRRFPPGMMAAWDDQYKRTTMEGEIILWN